MKRLYQKIYLTIVVTLLLVVLVTGAIWRFGQPPALIAEGFEVAGELLSATLPPADAPASAQQAAVRQFAQRLHANVALFDKDLQLIASYGDPPPPPRGQRPGFMPGAGALVDPIAGSNRDSFGNTPVITRESFCQPVTFKEENAPFSRTCRRATPISRPRGLRCTVPPSAAVMSCRPQHEPNVGTAASQMARANSICSRTVG